MVCNRCVKLCFNCVVVCCCCLFVFVGGGGGGWKEDKYYGPDLKYQMDFSFCALRNLVNCDATNVELV